MIRKIGSMRNSVSYLRRSSMYMRREGIDTQPSGVNVAGLLENELSENDIQLPARRPTPSVTKREEAFLPEFAHQNFL